MQKESSQKDSQRCPIEESWSDYKSRSEMAMQKIMATNDMVVGVKEDTKYLKDIAETLTSMNDNLIGVATGKRQVPLDVVLVLLFTFGIFWILVTIKDSDKSIRLNWSEGLVIEKSKEK